MSKQIFTDMDQTSPYQQSTELQDVLLNQNNGKRLYCENFWEEDGVKRGIALQGYHPDSTSKESTIYFCEHRKGSKDYEDTKSCISP